MDETRPKSSTSAGQEKKTQFDDLSKEELITKCKNFLSIAKKAKASKDEAFEEIKRLKSDLKQHEEFKDADRKSLETVKEIVDRLTENKLADANKIEALNRQLSDKEKSSQKQLTRLNETEIENEALKRQLQRFSDSLLAEMDSLEKKPIADANESNNNSELMEQIENLNNQISSFEKQSIEKARETKSLQDLIDHNSTKIKSLIQENSDLKTSIKTHSDTTPTDQVKIKYEKCIKKLKLYREKIYEISEKLNLLKADREILLETTKNYSECISKWQKDIATASMKMIESIHESNKQLRSKQEEIDELRKELASLTSENNVTSENIEKDYKQEIEALKETIRKKDKSLEEEREAQKKLKQAAKKTSVLDLEMEAYEKTLDEVNKKLEAKKVHVIEFENTIKVQNETMESLKSQITSLEANLESEKSHSIEVKKNLDSQQSLLRKTEHERTESNLQFELLNKNFESLKLENNEIRIEMAKNFGVLEKRYQVLESERDEHLKSILFLENEVEKFKKLSSSQEKEIEDLRSEFTSYKLRATSVLRQSQTKDFSKEQELQDEVMTLQKTLENFKNSNSKLTNDLESLKKNHNELTGDKTRLQSRCKDLLESMERHSDEVLQESRNRNQQHDESIKAYQLQIDTLNVFYKKKLQEKEDSMSELREKISNLEKTLASPPMQASIAYDSNMFQLRSEDHKMSMLMIDREDALLTRTEAEGSEDQSSQSSTHILHQARRKTSKSTRELMPLEELLNSSFDDNSNEINEETFSNFSSPSEILDHTKAKLMKEENRVGHLTSLLADAEKDLARMEQLNEMLKEEIRRQQRNVDREEHIQNSEYLKNIVIKFVTLANGDEKQRLLPVLNTILKLSSEENTLLQNACKGGWLWTK